MKKTELRIGNLVEYPAWNNDGSKAYFSIRDIYFEEGKIGLTNGIIQVPSSCLEFIKPIPLTEEWLLKFGFEEADNCLELEINESISIFYAGYLGLMIDGVFGFLENEQNFVHQLQNLYFALTNEELTLNHEN